MNMEVLHPGRTLGKAWRWDEGPLRPHCCFQTSLHLTHPRRVALGTSPFRPWSSPLIHGHLVTYCAPGLFSEQNKAPTL